MSIIYTPDERRLLEAWLRKRPITKSIDCLLRAEGIDEEPPHYTRLDAWVGRFLNRRRRVIGMKRHLGDIVWATSAPGFTYPGHYHMIWLPEFDVNAVTYTQEQNSPFGYPTFAIGHCEARELPWMVLHRDWRALHETYDQSPWEEWWPGELPAAQAAVCRQSAFSDEPETSWARSLEGGRLNRCQ